MKELEESDNPFAIVVLTHLRNLETKKDSQRRWQWKVELVKELYRRGFSESDVRKLFDFIDWLLALPEELENSFYQEITKFEEKQKMRFVNIAERRGELIGEILLAQRITGGQNYLRDELRKKNTDELKRIFAEIGLDKGLDKSELIGEILLAQRITGGQNYLRDDLRNKDTDELKRIFAEIEKKLNISYEH